MTFKLVKTGDLQLQPIPLGYAQFLTERKRLNISETDQITTLPTLVFSTPSSSHKAIVYVTMSRLGWGAYLSYTGGSVISVFWAITKMLMHVIGRVLIAMF